MQPTLAVLEITDGTTANTVNLLDSEFGFSLFNWGPGIATYKGGGVWKGSPLSDGRRLVSRVFDNVVESFELKLRGSSQDAAIRYMQNLRRLLEAAANYWDGEHQTTPIYIVAQSSRETNPRYAVVMSGAVPEDDNPYAPPFLQPSNAATMDNITLVIERGHWTENVPGSATAVKIAASQVFDGRTLGNVNGSGTETPTSNEEVFVANKHNIANLTHVFVNDGGVYGANLLDASLPYDLLPAVPAVGDAVYFICETATTDSGPFLSIVFDTSIAQSGCTIVWEYSTGGGVYTAFTAGDIHDATSDAGASDPFTETGVNAVYWLAPATWSANTANAITGLIVRARVTAAAAPSPPRQANRNIYSVVWNYVEIDSDQVGGDISALAQIYHSAKSGSRTGVSPLVGDSHYSRMICGLRSTSRGSNFRSFINIADEQNQTGITAIVTGGDSLYLSSVLAPSGRNGRYVPGAARSAAQQFRITLDSTIAAHYRGIFHAFVRVDLLAGTANDVGVQLKYVPLGVTTLEEDLSNRVLIPAVVSAGTFQLLDLGEVTLPPVLSVSPDDTLDEIRIGIFLDNTDATTNLYLYDLILIPVDEWAGDFRHKATASTQLDIQSDNFLDVDSIRYSRRSIRAQIRDGASENVILRYQSIVNGSARLRDNNQQRLWFLFDKPGSSTEVSSPTFGGTVQLFRNQRYLSLRGDR
jgi:hypothetical protein